MKTTTIVDVPNIDWRMSARDFDALIRDLGDESLRFIEDHLKTELGGHGGGSMSRVYSERLNQIQRARLAGRDRAAMHYRNRVEPVLTKVVLQGREPTIGERETLQQVVDHLADAFGIRANNDGSST